MAFANVSPTEVRALISAGTLKSKPTSQYCEGYKQANITIVPREYADDFEQFCRQNSGPMPLLYRSEPGELSAGPFAVSSNIKTELPGYTVFNYGKKVDAIKDLSEFDLSDFCTFYLGCSFSFYHALSSAGIEIQNVQQGKNVSMFITNIDCHPVGIFGSKMVVSMIPVAKSQLSKCATITETKMQFHGPPIHYGNPADIGIVTLESPDYGDAAEVKEGEVPVFFGCGVTGVQAIKGAKAIPIAFTHQPGMMFITDRQMSDDHKAREDTCVVEISQSRALFGVLSASAKQKLQKIEEIISEDRGNRGISPLRLPDDFVASCLALSQAKSVLLTTGFVSHVDDVVPYENDGPLGILSLASALLKFGKKVWILVEEPLKKVLKDAAMEWKRLSYNEENLNFKVISPSGINQEQVDGFDVLLALERVSPATDGIFYNMRARPVPFNEYTQHIENFFIKSSCLSIGIGDGGNELGMKKVADLVKKHVPNGEKIVSSVETDLLIIAGVSNWGAWGLAAGLFVLSLCDVHRRYLRKGLGHPKSPLYISVMPDIESEKRLLEIIEGLGMSDGICKKPMHVDNMPFDEDHTIVLQNLKTAAGL